ncbi:MAG: hypothetical protein O3B84_00540 [Chloroflexi bacterium]|nr:hypothetical protein [Chloroflexota bacterium]
MLEDFAALARMSPTQDETVRAFLGQVGARYGISLGDAAATLERAIYAGDAAVMSSADLAGPLERLRRAIEARPAVEGQREEFRPAFEGDDLEVDGPRRVREEVLRNQRATVSQTVRTMVAEGWLLWGIAFLTGVVLLYVGTDLLLQS